MHNHAFSVLTATLAALAVGGCGSAEREAADIPGPVEWPARIIATATATATATPKPDRAPSHVSAPVRVLIPSIGVDAPLVPLGLDAHRALEVPARFDVAGWWSGGFRPGERGPAVIAGHVDSTTGPAVFYELGELQRGATVIVRRRDGTSVRFVVHRSEHYPKDRFPTARVYGPTRRPALRLITCSGRFDHSTRHYLDNTVFYASA